jgi:hypothetical protein
MRAEEDSLDLAHCFLYEITTYAGNEGRYDESWFYPADPPFIGWRFRDPTDGRTGPVGLERFAASQGWAWDRHKIGGRLVPPADGRTYAIHAVQEYHFHCELCGLDAVLPGPDAGPLGLTREFAPHDTVWRYSITKHGITAWMDITPDGAYYDDSAHIGFSPWETGS